MRRRSWDQGVVWAPPARVYDAVSRPEAYAAWWPGARVDVADGRVSLRLEGLPRLEVTPERLRDGEGLFLRVDARYAGTMEWYLEPFEEGTIVNCLVELDIPGGPRRSRRRLLGLRGAIRRGLVGLKGALE